MKNKKLLCEGLFIRNDKKGVPCCVGDTVKLHRPPFDFVINDRHIDVGAQNWEGQIRVTLGRGLVVKCDKNYVKPTITDRCLNKWDWELVKKYSGEL
jgi:hypothetical protein